jgi:hypothetical protein
MSRYFRLRDAQPERMPSRRLRAVRRWVRKLWRRVQPHLPPSLVRAVRAIARKLRAIGGGR